MEGTQTQFDNTRDFIRPAQPDFMKAREEGKPAFRKGEVIELRGAKFKVHTLGKKFLKLKVLGAKGAIHKVD